MSRVFESCIKSLLYGCTDCVLAADCAEKQLYNKGRADGIDEYMNKLCDKCIQQPNECWNLECPFADDECQIIKIAEQLKEQINGKEE